MAETGGGASLLEMAQAWNATLAPLYKAVLSAGARWRGVGVKKIAPGGPSIEYTEIASDGVGDVTGDLAPPMVSGLISLRTATPGRHGHGRAYVGFPGEASSAPTGLPTTTYLADLDSLAFYISGGDTIVGAGGTADVLWCILDRATGAQKPTTHYAVRTEWASQRRRGRFGRPNTLPF